MFKSKCSEEILLLDLYIEVQPLVFFEGDKSSHIFYVALRVHQKYIVRHFVNLPINDNMKSTYVNVVMLKRKVTS